MGPFALGAHTTHTQPTRAAAGVELEERRLRRQPLHGALGGLRVHRLAPRHVAPRPHLAAPHVRQRQQLQHQHVLREEQGSRA